MLGKRPHQIQRSTSMSQLRVPPGARTRPPSPLAHYAHKDCAPQHDSCPSTPSKAAVGAHHPQTLAEEARNSKMTVPGAQNFVNMENGGSPTAHLRAHGPLKPPYVSLRGSSSLPLPKPTKVESFLDACFFCKRPLGHGRDIFMYRGDAAFCTEECRLRQISCDEKCSISASQTATTNNNTGESQKCTDNPSYGRILVDF